MFFVELTIIISCVLFITLLTFVNLIIYAMRKYEEIARTLQINTYTKTKFAFRLLKKTNNEVHQPPINSNGKKSYDILPGVGEIILWAAKDKRGYLIDINGSWYALKKVFFLK